jgi:hypothetical protein
MVHSEIKFKISAIINYLYEVSKTEYNFNIVITYICCLEQKFAFNDQRT